MFNAKDGKFGAAMICKAIRAHDATRVRQNLFDTFFFDKILATTLSTTILVRE